MERTALITGASGGIGREIARALAREKFDLVLVARRTEELERLAAELSGAHGVKAVALAADLARREAPGEIFRAVEGMGIQVDALVNDAGIGTQGPFPDIDLRRELDEIQVNVAALVHLTKLFVKPMVERRRGWILNVGSTAGFQPGPLMAVYYATKAFVNSFSEALSAELAGTGVSATVLCPGPTESGFTRAAGMEGSNLFKMMSVSRPAAVAEAGVRGMLRGRAIVIPGLMNKVAMQSNRFTPRAVVRAITRRLNARS